VFTAGIGENAPEIRARVADSRRRSAVWMAIIHSSSVGMMRTVTRLNGALMTDNAQSIAAGCAQAFHDCGARLAATYLNGKAEPLVRPSCRRRGRANPRSARKRSNEAGNRGRLIRTSPARTCAWRVSPSR
jgi:hypothetical protein